MVEIVSFRASSLGFAVRVQALSFACPLGSYILLGGGGGLSN